MLTDNQKERQARKYKKYLKQLVETVTKALKELDEEMHKPSNADRGKRIAAICNYLEYEKDRARHFGLGEKFSTLNNSGEKR